MREPSLREMTPALCKWGAVPSVSASLGANIRAARSVATCSGAAITQGHAMLTLLLRGFSIRLRMVGAIAMVLVLLAMVGGAGFFGLSQVQSKSEEFSSVLFHDEVALSELRLQLGNLRRYEKDVALSVGARDEAAAYLARWQKAVTTMCARLPTALATSRTSVGASHWPAASRKSVSAPTPPAPNRCWPRRLPVDAQAPQRPTSHWRARRSGDPCRRGVHQQHGTAEHAPRPACARTSRLRLPRPCGGSPWRWPCPLFWWCP